MARQVQTVLVSMVLHIAALFILVVIPLLAMDGLPGVPSLTRYVPVEIKTPPVPPAPAPSTPSPQSPADIAGPPIEAPTTITAEAPERPPAIAPVPGIDGGLGLPGMGNRLPEATNVPPPPTTTVQEPVRAGGLVKAPVRTVYVPPTYPPIAISARVSGTVIIEAVIGIDGSVRDAKVLRSIPLLDEAALAAVRQWRYTPTTLNGIPVPVIMTVSVRFELGGPIVF